MILPGPGQVWTIYGARRLSDGTIDAGVCSGSHPGPEPPPRRGPAGIAPQRGIDGVLLGASAAEVLQIHGAPPRAGPSPLHAGWRRWTYPARGLRIDFTERGAAWAIATTSRRPRTPRGAGVGSSERRLRRALPRIGCRWIRGPRPVRSCLLGRPRLGRPFTDFTLRRGRVARATVAAGLAV